MKCEYFMNAMERIGYRTCGCNSGYVWNGMGCVMQLDCQVISHTDGVVGDGTVCGCVLGYYWDRMWAACRINCSMIPNAIINTSLTSCSCEVNRMWNGSACACIYSESNTCLSLCSSSSSEGSVCIVNCSNIQYSTSTEASLACSCQSPAYWSSSARACLVNCSQIPNTNSNTENATSCSCKSSIFYWSSSSISCVSNCASQINAIS